MKIDVWWSWNVSCMTFFWSKLNRKDGSKHPWWTPTHHHHHLVLNHKGCWGSTDDFTTIFLYFSLFSTTLWDLANSRSVNSLMLSSHLFLCLPCFLPPFTVPCKMVLARPDQQTPTVVLKIFPLADCSRGLHCWSSHIVPEWLEPDLPLCWSFWGPATGLYVRLCQTPSWSLWSCGTDYTGVVGASLWWLDYWRSVLLCFGLVWNLLVLLPAVPQSWSWVGWG